MDQERRRERRGLWQSTQGLEAKRLIPQKALHPGLIRREFYERFERYILFVCGVEARVCAEARTEILDGAKETNSNGVSRIYRRQSTPLLDIFADSVCFAQGALPGFSRSPWGHVEDSG